MVASGSDTEQARSDPQASTEDLVRGWMGLDGDESSSDEDDDDARPRGRNVGLGAAPRPNHAVDVDGKVARKVKGVLSKDATSKRRREGDDDDDGERVDAKRGRSGKGATADADGGDDDDDESKARAFTKRNKTEAGAHLEMLKKQPKNKKKKKKSKSKGDAGPAAEPAATAEPVVAASTVEPAVAASDAKVEGGEFTSNWSDDDDDGGPDIAVESLVAESTGPPPFTEQKKKKALTGKDRVPSAEADNQQAPAKPKGPRRKKTRSKQKNIKKDTRPIDQRPTYRTKGSKDYRPITVNHRPRVRATGESDKAAAPA